MSYFLPLIYLFSFTYFNLTSHLWSIFFLNFYNKITIFLLWFIFYLLNIVKFPISHLSFAFTIIFISSFKFSFQFRKTSDLSFFHLFHSINQIPICHFRFVFFLSALCVNFPFLISDWPISSVSFIHSNFQYFSPLICLFLFFFFISSFKFPIFLTSEFS